MGQVKDVITDNNGLFLIREYEFAGQRVIGLLDDHAFANPLPELILGCPKLLSVATDNEGIVLLSL